MNICQFLQLDFKIGMLDFYRTVNEKEDFNYNPLYEKAHRNLGEEINTSKIGTGKEGLSREERNKIAFVLNEYGKKYGYEGDLGWKGEKLRLTAAKELIIILFNKWITRTYYLLPFPLRKKIGYVAQWLFNKFGIYTVHNQEDNANMIYKTKPVQND
jgi:hypothetical protein